MECSDCKKTFPEKKNLLKHRRNVHNIYCISKERRKDCTTNTYNCQYCKKEYTLSSSRWIHEKKCKILFEEEQKRIELLEKENERQRKENERQRKEIEDLREQLIKSKKIKHKNFQALNKMLIERSIINGSNNNNNNNVINNTINYNIVTFGKEELLNALTIEQKQQILDCRLNSLEKLVEIAHCGDMNEFKNIIITNLKDNFAYKYDEKKGYFVTCTKNDLLDQLVTLRLTDIEEIYTELRTAKLIDPRTKAVIQTFLDKMENNDLPVVEGETRYPNYRSYKINSIKILLYNNLDRITKNVALLISE
jgi:hypothetical protein